MKKYLVRQDRTKCIGCGSCAALCQSYWLMGSDNKADLQHGKKVAAETFELEIEAKDYDCNKQAADICPVQCISVVEK